MTLRLGGSEASANAAKGIHNQIDPEHLGNRKRKFVAEDRAQQNDDDRYEIDCQLEQNESLDVAIERTAPHDSCGDTAERVVERVMSLASLERRFRFPDSPT